MTPTDAPGGERSSSADRFHAATPAPAAPASVVSLGAGTMGAGIALAFALGGSSVTMVARRRSTLDRAQLRIERSLDLLAAAGVAMDGGQGAVPARITSTTDLAGVDLDVDLVVESIVEDLDAKRELFRTVEPRLGPSTVLCTDTSAIPLAALAEGLDRPDRFLGYHWFNPAELMALVEVVPTERTAPEVADRLVAWSLAIGKEPVRMERAVEGFIANRLQYALMREAYRLVDDGVCTPEDVDRAVTAGLGPRWAAVGPFQAMDLAGLDVHRTVVEQLFPLLSVEGGVPATLRRLGEEGALGVKSGLGLRGLYDDDSARRLAERRDAVLLALAELRRRV